VLQIQDDPSLKKLFFQPVLWISAVVIDLINAPPFDCKTLYLSAFALPENEPERGGSSLV